MGGRIEWTYIRYPLEYEGTEKKEEEYYFLNVFTLFYSKVEEWTLKINQYYINDIPCTKITEAQSSCLLGIKSQNKLNKVAEKTQCEF